MTRIRAVRTLICTGLALGVLAGAGLSSAQANDALHAQLPPALFKQKAAAKIYPVLYQRELHRKNPSWARFLRGARETYMRSHPCSTATLERRYRTGYRSSWSTVLATWQCDGVDSGTQSFLTCIAGVEGGRTRPDVWYRGDYPAPVVGWHPEFVGTDRVVNHFQTRPYHAHKVEPGIYDSTVTYQTFRILTDPVNAARIAVMVGPSAYATMGVCS